jgi:hypothetical protein
MVFTLWCRYAEENSRRRDVESAVRQLQARSAAHAASLAAARADVKRAQRDHSDATAAAAAELERLRYRNRCVEEALAKAEAGLYNLNPVDPCHSLKAPGFNPCAYQVISWFHHLLSNSTCTATPGKAWRSAARRWKRRRNVRARSASSCVTNTTGW